MAKDQLFFQAFAKVHPEVGDPVRLDYLPVRPGHRADLRHGRPLLGYFTLVQLLNKSHRRSATIFVLRRKPGYDPKWKMPMGYAMAGVAMFMTGTLIVSTFLWAPMAGLIAALVAIGTGLPAYYFWESRRRRERPAR